MLVDNGKSLDKVIELKVDESALIDRISGRRVHQSSGRTYHTKFNPPKVPGKDDVTGEDLYQRPDDNEHILKTRLDSYKKETVPILDYYSKQGKLTTVDSMKDIEHVWTDIKNNVFGNIQ